MILLIQYTLLFASVLLSISVLKESWSWVPLAARLS